MNRKILWCYLLTMVSLSEAYRILGLFPYHGKSHNVMFDSLAKGIAERGHVIDVITHYPLKNPPKNYNVLINLDGTMPRVVNSFTFDMVMGFKGMSVDKLVNDYGNPLCELMGLDSMQKFIKNLSKKPSYDLIIVEAFAANCYMGFGVLLNVPVIAVSSAIEYPWISKFIGNDDNLAYVSIPSMNVIADMDFWQRLQNFYQYHSERYLFDMLTEENQTASMRKYLSPDMPNIREVENNVALTLVNSQPPIFGVKPVTPGLVYVGGLHVGHEDTRLPKELQKWLDESTSGLVYFTFGSLVIMETLPEDKLKTFYSSFSKIKPVRVLMKVHDKTKLPPGLPSNVMTHPWIPQQAVLAHNNTRAFITHGGLMGCQEALYNGVPLIGIPLFGDQVRNVATFVAKNMSIALNIRDITGQSLDNALDAVLNDPKYTYYADYNSKLFRDRSMTAMETAIFWIEYTIRNGPVLRSPVLKLPFWKLKQFDIYAFILLIAILGCVVVYAFLKFVMKLFSTLFLKKLKTQ